MKMYILVITICLLAGCTHRTAQEIEKDQEATEKMHDEFIHDKYESSDYESDVIQ